ncbi:MAG: hypothetical protein ACQERD_10645 [Campylobacterota bacterium]
MDEKEFYAFYQSPLFSFSDYINSTKIFFASTYTFPLLLDDFYKKEYQYLYLANSWIGALKTKSTWLDKKAFFRFLVLSPSVLYWSSTFSKDILSLSFAVLAATFLYRRSYFFGLLFIGLGLLIRPYSIATVVAIYLFLNNEHIVNRYKKYVVTVYIFVYALFTSWIVLLNTVMLFVFVFASPVVYKLQNWELIVIGKWNYSPFLFTIEGMFSSVILMLFLLFSVINKSFRFFSKEFIFPFVLLSTALGAMGYYTSFESYGLGTLGDNMVRKKLIFWPLISVVFAMVSTHILNKLNKKKRKNETTIRT